MDFPQPSESLAQKLADEYTDMHDSLSASVRNLEKEVQQCRAYIAWLHSQFTKVDGGNDDPFVYGVCRFRMDPAGINTGHKCDEIPNQLSRMYHRSKKD